MLYYVIFIIEFLLTIVNSFYISIIRIFYACVYKLILRVVNNNIILFIGKRERIVQVKS